MNKKFKNNKKEEVMIKREQVLEAIKALNESKLVKEKIKISENDWLPLEDIHTPNVCTIEEVSAFLKVKIYT